MYDLDLLPTQYQWQMTRFSSGLHTKDATGWRLNPIYDQIEYPKSASWLALTIVAIVTIGFLGQGFFFRKKWLQVGEFSELYALDGTKYFQIDSTPRKNQQDQHDNEKSTISRCISYWKWDKWGLSNVIGVKCKCLFQTPRFITNPAFDTRMRRMCGSCTFIVSCINPQFSKIEPQKFHPWKKRKFIYQASHDCFFLGVVNVGNNTGKHIPRAHGTHAERWAGGWTGQLQTLRVTLKSGSYGFRFNVSGHLSFCRFFVAFVVVKPALVEKRRCFSQKVGWKNLMSLLLFAHFLNLCYILVIVSLLYHC